MFGFLRSLFRRDRGPAQPLESVFQAHFRHFRALLTANNNALELMAQAEDMLQSGRPFGMAFVRGELTALTVNVYKMVHSLIALSDGRYQALAERFSHIAAEIEKVLSREPQVVGRELVLGLEAIDRHAVDEVGSKMANLGELRNRLGLRTPDGFVVTAAAAKHFMDYSQAQPEIARRLQTLDIDDLEQLYLASDAIQDLIRAAPMPPDLQQAIATALADLTRRQGRADYRVALRSSAIGEDGGHGSFAGLYRTRLNLRPAEVHEAYPDILASKYQSRAILYRLQRGYRHQDVHMCVGCLVMVDARASGVLFTRPPDAPESGQVVIYAARGLGDQIVEGCTPYDLFQVAREAPHAILARQLADGRQRACLTDAEVQELAAIAVRVEDHFGVPQDIEWAIDRKGDLYFLQTRPLEVVESKASSTLLPLAELDKLPPLLSGGVTASMGAAAGPVFKVTCALDVLQFPKGAVLVVETPYPEWAVLISRAAAVVSETGQSATHLATVAREFAIPALFGVSGALSRLENGQVITVCAGARKVFAGRIEALLAVAQCTPRLMQGSPVHGLLLESLTLVTPLHLTDPDSPFFKAANCRTLHDITRFCHEKALHEMFNFGRRHGARDRSAKQLYVGENAAQWWVVDLKDGYRPGADLSTQFIRIEDIVSEPMRAIWAGMTAVPWQGPPPVSMRALGAIIAQSAMNPQLDPAVRSSMGERNYFLISRKYCNLSVRLGYHFAIAEANFSELLTESYLSFQFQGGAADERRRQQRVRLLGRLLRELDFRVDIKGDRLTARIEKRPVPYLKERLTILGYLLIHSRQVDMAMEEEGFIERFLDKVRADIRMIRQSMNENTQAEDAVPQESAAGR